jgi:O-succinylbenzoic acid--CoA ligase
MIVIRCLTGSLDLRLIEPQISLDLTGLESIDFSAMVPLQAWNALNTSAYHFPIRKLIIGGAEISAELEDLTSNLTTEVFASYGMAETCSHVALRRLNGSGAQSDYHALPEVTLTRDKRGCLVISSTYLPDQIVTNDLVEFTGNGTFKWVGRVDNLINSAGVKIVPEEMEAAIMTKTGLRCTVVGIPDTRLGKKLILAVEKQDEKSMVTDLELCIRELFPKHKWPKRIIYLERFPRNSSFKVDRHELTRMVSGMI